MGQSQVSLLSQKIAGWSWHTVRNSRKEERPSARGASGGWSFQVSPGAGSVQGLDGSTSPEVPQTPWFRAFMEASSHGHD